MNVLDTKCGILVKAIGVVGLMFGSLVHSAYADPYKDIQQAADHGEIEQISPYTQSDNLFLSAFSFYQISQAYLVHGQVDQAKQAAAHAQNKLEALLTNHPTHVNGLGLYSIVLGHHIGLDFSKAMSFGPKSGEYADKALAIDDENPIALMAKGINLHYTPAFFGGSNKEADIMLTKAIVNFKQEGQSSSWGLADAYAWRGTVRMDMGNSDDAMMDAKAAMAITPKDFIANQVFLTASKQ